MFNERERYFLQALTISMHQYLHFKNDNNQSLDCINCRMDLGADKAHNLLQDNLLAVTLGSFAIVKSVYFLVLSDQLLLATLPLASTFSSVFHNSVAEAVMPVK